MNLRIKLSNIQAYYETQGLQAGPSPNVGPVHRLNLDIAKDKDGMDNNNI